MNKAINNLDLPFLVDTDQEGNLVLSSKAGEGNASVDMVDEDQPIEDDIIVTLVGFDSKVLQEFSETEVDEDLYDIGNFAKAVSEKLKLQEAE